MMINGIKINNAAVPYCGKITEVNDTEVTIRIAGRMGILKLPLRAVISRNHPQVGEEVRFLMSLIEMKNDGFDEEGELV